MNEEATFIATISTHTHTHTHFIVQLCEKEKRAGDKGRGEEDKKE